MLDYIRQLAELRAIKAGVCSGQVFCHPCLVIHPLGGVIYWLEVIVVIHVLSTNSFLLQNLPVQLYFNPATVKMLSNLKVSLMLSFCYCCSLFFDDGGYSLIFACICM